MKQISESIRSEAHDLWALVLEKRSAARMLSRERFLNDCLSRSYYSAFHAVTLLFLLEERTFSSHKQIIGTFNKEFVHTSLFPEQVARDFGYLFESRQSGDYDYHIAFDEAEAATGLEKLDSILEAIRDYVDTRFEISLKSLD